MMTQSLGNSPVPRRHEAKESSPVAVRRSPVFGRRSSRANSNRRGDSPRFPAAVPRGILPSAQHSVDKYVQLKELHTSKFSTVYLAQCISTREKVVLKYQTNDMCTHAEHKALQCLRHASVVKLLGVDHIENVLILEYLEGKDLFDWAVEFHEGEDPACQAGTASEIESVVGPICSQIHEALVYCHNAGVAHRDLKLENIMVDSKRQIKLVDFGLCYIERVTADPLRLCGSTEYAAPEFLNNKVTSKDAPFKADAWSFGVVIYVLTHFLFPYVPNANNEEYHLSPANAKFSRPLRRLIRSLLDKDPQTRPLVTEVETTWLKRQNQNQKS